MGIIHSMPEDTIILGIDTSCDDTSAAVVRDGTAILSNVVSSQTAVHRKYGGIVPELASRRHIEMIWPVVDEALSAAGVGLDGLSAVAVCRGPGLIGSLLVGCLFGKSVCYSRRIPLIGVNHLEGHVFAPFLTEPAPEFPFISLVVSGGHTALYRIDGFGRYRELGRTRDDAAGEAYDKVAKMLGLGYPGGPVIDRLARGGDPKAVRFPRPYLQESFDFSFSGLKTAVRIYIECNKGKDLPVADICASFQRSVIDVLVRKCGRAIEAEGVKRLALTGGVAANSELRDRIADLAVQYGVGLFIPQPVLCTDNAAMIAAAGHFHFINGDLADMTLNPKAYLPLA